MRRALVLGMIASIGLVVGAPLFIVSQTRVSPEAIQSSVLRAPELMDKA